MNGRTQTENTENKDILNGMTKKSRQKEGRWAERREAATKTREEPTERLPENYTKKND